MLALGIGATAAVFSIVDAVLLRPSPFAAPDQLIQIEESNAKHPVASISADDFLRLRDRRDLFERVGAFTRDYVTIRDSGDPDQVIAERVSGGLFGMLGVQAALGRTLLDADDELNAPKVAVLSDHFWRNRFHADRDAIGQKITISDEAFTVIGVMPAEFEFPSPDVVMWTPLRLTGTFLFNLHAVARIRPDLSIPRLQSAMDILARQLEQEDQSKRDGLRIRVSRWQEERFPAYQLTLILVLAAVALVLLVACVDVASLLLGRALQRQKEIAIRASLGAGVWHVLRQLLAEGLALALLGTAGGLCLAHFALRYLLGRLTTLPIMLPHLGRAAINERALLFNSVLCVVLACICSLAPILLASKTDLQGALRGGPAGGASKRSARLFSILIAAETAFAFLLLLGSGLMLRSLIKLQESDHGFVPDHVLTMRVPIGTVTVRPSGKLESKPGQMAYYHDLLDRIKPIPGLKAVAVVNNLPLSDVNTTTDITGPDQQPLNISTRTISSQYFSAMGIQVLSGRGFTDADRTGSPEVAIINEYLARLLFPDRDPIGRTLNIPSNPKSATIVGVVKNSPQRSYIQPAKGELYRPYEQAIFGVFMSTIVARTSGDPLPLAATLRREIWAVNPNQPVVKIATMNDVIADSIWRPRFSAWLFTILGSLALLLTSAGVYGVVAYTASLRTREVGIRTALGAAPRTIVALIVRDALFPVVFGLAIGLAGALLLARLMSSLLYETSPGDPLTYAVVAVLLLAVGTIASIVPACKAAVADPVAALRMD